MEFRTSRIYFLKLPCCYFLGLKWYLKINKYQRTNKCGILHALHFLDAYQKFYVTVCIVWLRIYHPQCSKPIWNPTYQEKWAKVGFASCSVASGLALDEGSGWKGPSNMQIWSKKGRHLCPYKLKFKCQINRQFCSRNYLYCIFAYIRKKGTL